MAVVGYARVSTVHQDYEIQLKKLKAENCDRIFCEKMSGKDRARPELRNMMSYVRDGDTVLITRLDRLARSTGHLIMLMDELKHKNVQFRVLDQPVDTASPYGKMLLSFLAIIAEFENDLRSERQNEGIQEAKIRGVKFGRKPKLTPSVIESIKNLRNCNYTIRDICDLKQLSHMSVYRALNS